MQSVQGATEFKGRTGKTHGEAHKGEVQQMCKNDQERILGSKPIRTQNCRWVQKRCQQGQNQEEQRWQSFKFLVGI